MGRVYITSFQNVAVSAVQDLFEVLIPSDSVVVLHEIHVTQSTEFGDAASEQLRGQIKRGVGSTSGSGGSTHTPDKTETGDAAAGSTVEINNTTQAVAGGGSLTTLLEESFSVHVGWHYVPTPEARLIYSPDEELIVSLGEAPDDAITMSGYLVFEEIGG